MSQVRLTRGWQYGVSKKIVQLTKVVCRLHMQTIDYEAHARFVRSQCDKEICCLTEATELEMAKRDTTIARLENEKCLLKAKLDEIIKDVNAIKERSEIGVELLEKAALKFRKESQRLGKENTSLQERFDRASEKIRDLTEQLKVMNEKGAEMEERDRDRLLAEKMIEDGKKEIGELKERLVASNQRIDECERDKTARMEEYEGNRTDFELLKEAKSASDEKVRVASREIDELRERVKKMSEMIEGHEKENTEKDGTIEKLRKEKESFESNTKKLKRTNNKTIRKLTEELTSHKGRFDKAEKQKRSETDKRRDLEEKMKVVTQENENNLTEIRRLKKCVLALQTKSEVVVEEFPVFEVVQAEIDRDETKDTAKQNVKLVQRVQILESLIKTESDAAAARLRAAYEESAETKNRLEAKVTEIEVQDEKWRVEDKIRRSLEVRIAELEMRQKERITSSTETQVSFDDDILIAMRSKIQLAERELSFQPRILPEVERLSLGLSRSQILTHRDEDIDGDNSGIFVSSSRRASDNVPKKKKDRSWTGDDDPIKATESILRLKKRGSNCGLPLLTNTEAEEAVIRLNSSRRRRQVRVVVGAT